MPRRSELPDIDLLIANLQEAKAAGGQLAAYDLTPELYHTGGFLVRFRAELWMPKDWRPTLKDP